MLIERSKWWRWCFWSKGQSTEDDVADRKVKVLKMMLLIERSKCWRCCCCCWSKDQSTEDVADQNAEDIVVDRKVKVLKMLLLIEESRCWRCCWSKRSKYWWCWRLKIEDEDYMMLKIFQWFIDVSPWWCWWCPLSLSYCCCCWSCYRIPFSLRGSVEIL